MSLESLGYTFVPGATGDPSDWVLRQAADTSKGFEWKGQENCAYFPPPLPAPPASHTHTHRGRAAPSVLPWPRPCREQTRATMPARGAQPTETNSRN